MSLFKSILITAGIFIVIGFLGWVCLFIEQEKKADKTLAIAKDLYNKGRYEGVLKKIGDDIPFRHREDFLFIKLESLMELGKFYEAETVSEDLLKINPKNDKYYYLLGLLYFNEGDMSKSAQALKKAVELQPKNIDYKLNLARVFVHNNNTNDAIKVYRQIMKEDPRYEVAWAETADIYKNKGNIRESLKLRIDAAKRFPNNAYDQYMLGVIYDEMHMKNQAVTALKRALEIQPDAAGAKERLEKLTGKPYLAAFGKTEKVPLYGINNLLIADARINNTAGKFLIDTGASATIIYERFLKKNNIKVVTDTYGVLQMASGHKTIAPATYIDVQLGNNSLAATRAFILPGSKSLNLDGIIGMDVLNNFNFQIDKNKDFLVITR